MSASSPEAQAIERTRERIAVACRACGRDPREVTLLAVSKGHPGERLRAAHAAGQRAFGENYAQECVRKIGELADLADIEWHFIGPLQSNKTRLIAESVAWVHSIDRLSIAERLSVQRPNHREPLQVCVQVNVSGERSKSGAAPEHAIDLVEAIARCHRLSLRGLMALPEATTDRVAVRAQFRLLRSLFDAVRERHPDWTRWDTLSMGMSADLEDAIAEGSTLVRLGTAIFGARPAREH